MTEDKKVLIYQTMILVGVWLMVFSGCLLVLIELGERYLP